MEARAQPEGCSAGSYTPMSVSLCALLVDSSPPLENFWVRV